MTARSWEEMRTRIAGQLLRQGRLLDGSKTAGGSVNLRVPLAGVDDLDDEAADLLRRAYTANL